MTSESELLWIVVCWNFQQTLKTDFTLKFTFTLILCCETARGVSLLKVLLWLVFNLAASLPSFQYWVLSTTIECCSGTQNISVYFHLCLEQMSYWLMYSITWGGGAWCSNIVLNDAESQPGHWQSLLLNTHTVITYRIKLHKSNPQPLYTTSGSSCYIFVSRVDRFLKALSIQATKDL